MRQTLTAFVTLFLMAVLHAPAAMAEDEAEGWSEPQGVPAAEAAKAEEPAARPSPGGRTELEARAKAEKEAKDQREDGEEPLAAPKPFVMPTESTILGVRKNHNAPWVGNWLALELDMTVAVVGQAGKSVGATVTFYETGNERPLRAAMRPYVDSVGNLSVYTQLVPIQTDTRLFRARLKIPYRAFPWPTKGPTYGVAARVRLMSRDPSGEFAVLDRSETSFTIHYEKGCGCPPAGGQIDCGKCAEWKWDYMYTWCKVWGDDLGLSPMHVPCLPPPKGTGRRADWFEARWRTRGSPVDEMQRRIDIDTYAPTAPR